MTTRPIMVLPTEYPCCRGSVRGLPYRGTAIKQCPRCRRRYELRLVRAAVDGRFGDAIVKRAKWSLL